MFVIKSGINPKFFQTTNCIGLTSEFFARDIREDLIALKIKTMLHDLYLWFSLLFVSEKSFENRNDESLSDIYQNFSFL